MVAMHGQQFVLDRFGEIGAAFLVDIVKCELKILTFEHLDDIFLVQEQNIAIAGAGVIVLRPQFLDETVFVFIESGIPQFDNRRIAHGIRHPFIGIRAPYTSP